jgi:MFS family permease
LGRTLGFNATQTGLVLGAGAIAGLPAALFAGSLTARFGARRVLSWSMALAGIALAGFALLQSLALLATAAALHNAAWAAINVAHRTLLSQLAPPERLEAAFGYDYWVMNLGGVIGPLLGAALGGGVVRAPFFIFAAALSLAGILVAIVFRGYGNPSQNRGFAFPIGALLQKPALVILALAVAVFFLIESQDTSNLARFIGLNYPEGPGLFALCMTIAAITVVVCQPLAARFAAGKGWTIAGGLLYLAGPIATYFLWPQGGYFWFIYFVARALGEIILAPKLQAALAHSAGAKLAPHVWGVYVLVINLSFAVGPLVGGAVLDQIGISPLLLGLAILGATGTILALAGLARAQNSG